MSRDEGFGTADVDVGLLDDPKVRRLVRSLGDPDESAACALLYVALVLGSWAEGDRLTVDEAAPLWLAVTPDRRSALRAADLTDDEGRIPEAAWISWYGIAHDRRAASRAAARERSQRRRDRHADVTPKSRVSHAPPTGTGTGPTVPSVPTGSDPNARAANGSAPTWPGFGSEWDAFREAWTARNFHKPPTYKQRRALWGEGEDHGAVRDWSPTVGTWVAEAPAGAKAAEVVGYVLRRYHAAVAEGA